MDTNGTLLLGGLLLILLSTIANSRDRESAFANAMFLTSVLLIVSVSVTVFSERVIPAINDFMFYYSLP